MPFTFYTDKFSNLNMDIKGGHKRPHKVCMLLAVMELIEFGVITSNRIEFDSQLKATFTSYFNQRRRDNDRDTPENPFYHLKSESFWHLAYQPGVDPAMVSGYSKKNVSHAFLDEALFTFMKSPITRNDLKDALNQNLSDLAFLYRQWLGDTGHLPETIEHYCRVIEHDLPVWLQQQELTDVPVLEIKSFRAFHELVVKINQNRKLQVQDSRTHGVFSQVIESYLAFLKDFTQVDLQKDVSDIIDNQSLTETEKQILVNTRMGQGTYRRQLIDLWQGCAVTGYRNTQMLVASHIKPWRKSTPDEKLDKFNGLLLVANLDKAFDRGFISFDSHGKILIARCLESPEVLGIREEMSVALLPEHQTYLGYHRGELFKGR
ncbi:HNH endonuclease [Vibrio salinus]|uniref:HNH endonuclease n=1 Tax=Vibrio salinus TaxID=2899784 RepID=UPI001E339828|nr:HNH endonuclease [Vibrio salinus]MCE0495933.1 HNH endonuclease [Vibrio salinus]